MGASSRRWMAVLTASLLVIGVLAVPAAAADHGRVATLTDGLNNPRGITIAPDGTLYVAEAGTGGDEFCLPMEEAEVCMGATAGVAAIAPDGTVTRVVEGLPSLVAGEGEFAGAADVVVAADGSLYISVAFGAESPVRDQVAAEWEPAAMLGTIQHAVDGELTEVADLAAWETANDPDAGQPSTEGPMGQPSDHSNPNGMLLTSDGRLLVTDSGGNSALEVDVDTGELTMVAHFEDRFTAAPPFLGLPEGTQVPMQTVPTNLAEAADGSVLVSQLTGFPFPVDGANIYALTDTTTPEVLHEGFTNVMDLEFVGDDLYVVELAQNGLLAGPAGALVRVRADGSRVSLLADQLPAPGGVAADADGMLHLTVNSIGAPGSGAVLRFDPSLAADADIQAACPPLSVPGTALSDVAGTTHEEAITCAVWHGLFVGLGDGTFGPGSSVTRGQFATTVAALIRASDVDLPSGEAGRFTDVDGTTHAAAINDLAAAGMVSGLGDGRYLPDGNVTRAQAASVMVAAYAYITSSSVPPVEGTFGDIAGNRHAEAIEAAAGMGWVRGTGDGDFSPDGDLTRGQWATVLSRGASDLAEGGFLRLPS